MRTNRFFAIPVNSWVISDYCLAVTEELTENEFDHVFVGVWNGTPNPDPAEVAEWDWRAPEALARELQTHPDRFSRWLPLAWEAVRGSATVRATALRRS